MQRKIEIGGSSFFYEYEVRKVKNLNLRIRRDGSVHVSCPRAVPVGSVDAFVHSHIRFIEQARKRLLQREKRGQEREDCLFYRGTAYPLTYTVGRRRLVLSPSGAVLFCPDPLDPAKRRLALEKCVKELFYPVLLAACREVEPLFAAQGVAPAKEIRLRNMKSMWGNCRPKTGVLTFSTMLATVAPAEARYVVCHEYAHFLHPDHSAAFYRTLATVCPDYKERRLALRRKPSPVPD